MVADHVVKEGSLQPRWQLPEPVSRDGQRDAAMEVAREA